VDADEGGLEAFATWFLVGERNIRARERRRSVVGGLRRTLYPGGRHGFVRRGRHCHMSWLGPLARTGLGRCPGVALSYISLHC